METPLSTHLKTFNSDPLKNNKQESPAQKSFNANKKTSNLNLFLALLKF